MFRHSLRARVLFAFGLFAALLGITSGFGTFAAIVITEDRILEKQLRLSLADYVARSAVDPDAALPHSAYVKSYRDPVDLPTALRAWAAGAPDDGYYEFENEDLHVAVAITGAPAEPLYIVADVSGIEASDSEEVWLITGLVAVVSMLTLLAIAVGAYIGRRAIHPVVSLAKAVGDLNPEQLSDDDWRRLKAERFHDDEVGLLARTIEKTLKRICAFIERERYFTSAASHELRTPLTVIRGAVELLEQADLSRDASRAMARIKRATVDMQTTVDMFLCLSRESDDSSYREHFEVGPLVDRVLEQQRHLLANKDITVEVKHLASSSLLGHPQAFAIAIGNLVRNAFEHTPRNQGPISVCVGQYEVSISNPSARDMDDPEELSQRTSRGREARGFGLGLGIVERLCEHNGWTFTLRVNHHEIDARLSWGSRV
ncbi:sensor histidine kinase [Sinimarinibacterium flocculans]|uniref:sensor histidine kinase n=1 Tax=Sinimarinibacterium flocculans TaxID=985250 RepID=UPI0024931966|nr:HAMP domain-containing sensor histidine kinase [Sinimarinibacterium flocculans]